MHAAIERNSWRLPPEEIVQVADPRTKKAQPGDVEEELTYPDRGEGRNWLSVVLSLLVIAAVVSGILTAIHSLGYVDELLYWSGRRLSLQEVLQGEISGSRLSPAWVSGSHFLFQADDGGLSVFSTVTDNVSSLVSNHTLRQLNVKWFQGSHDLNFVLLRHNVKKVYKNTFLAYYTIYDVRNDHHIPIRLKEETKVQQSWLRYASWCGNTTRIVLVAEDNNIYTLSSPGQLVEVPITTTGRPGLVYNGIPDWLYQEEFAQLRQSMWCSGDGAKLLYASYDDRGVRGFQYPWLEPHPHSAVLFPSSNTLKYPTPGTPNPVVDLWIADLSSLEIDHQKILPPQVFQNKEYYLISANWVSEDAKEVAAVWLNRAQNLSLVTVCAPPTWVCIEIHAERAAEGGWVMPKGAPIFAGGNESFLLVSRLQEGDRGKFSRVKLVTSTDGQRRIGVISHGRIHVSSILAWDYSNKIVYYLGIDEDRAGQRHLFAVGTPQGGQSAARPVCITCNNTKRLYDNCTYFNAYLPPPPYPDNGIRRYVVECQGPGLPVAVAHGLPQHKPLLQLYTARGAGKLSGLALPLQRTFHVPLGHGLGRATVQLLLPPSWREELRDAAFPVLIEVNGKPGETMVTEKFNIDWGTYVSSQFDVVYVRVDVLDEGSIYADTRLVGMRIQDYIGVIKYLLDTLKFLDKERIAVWGSGFGGYITTMMLSSQNHVVKCGISISPITDWLFYNSAFTERILGLSSESYKDYVEADAVQRAKHVEAGSLYLLHGLADISVPYSHSLSLAAALARSSVLFRYQSYADEGHDFSGVKEHVYLSMEEFLSQCLSLDNNEQVGL
ncbi:inactive dipeptidyl peptidase 10 isoform X2 [Halyomorpha halys]|uniref:inactive dipeptidyl peptidase 10 isoform X2 n=1 Tax=Halyomorpha halys TaxID=286706 RepID=UPI0006D52027|nr:inactive dipeptidyl peptidase 10 isoform X2 [Halyomorpha halys]